MGVTPLIGIVCLKDDARPGRRGPVYRQNATYAHAVEAAGGAPVLIPLLENETVLEALYRRLDGLLLTGGPDVDPCHYGEPSHQRLELVDRALDRVELTLAKHALAEDRPILGICRGLQVINVALGGSLYQDIASQVPGALDHRPSDKPRDWRAHDIAILPGTRLAAVFGCTSLPVNSIHHQAVKRLAPELIASAYAPDGVLEGLEHPQRRFALGVQFHAEELYQQDESIMRLFRAFIAAAQESR